MKTKIIIGIVIVILIAVAVYYIFINPKDRNTSFLANPEYFSDEEAVTSVYKSYIEAGQNCDIDLANSIITEKSKEIIHYTCSNLKNETKCYIGRDYEIRINGDNAVLYLTPFNHKVENPFFFSKENGEWKINFYKMWSGLYMAGSTCDSGWGWRNQELADEFCSYFEPGECPDE